MYCYVLKQWMLNDTKLSVDAISKMWFTWQLDLFKLHFLDLALFLYSFAQPAIEWKINATAKIIVI